MNLADISNGASQAAGASAIFVIFMLLFYAAIFGAITWMYWRVAQQAGYPGWYAFALFVPILNIVAIIMFAFKKWPVTEERDALRAQLGYGGGPSGPAGPGYPAPPQGGYGAPSYPSAPSGYPAPPARPSLSKQDEGDEFDYPTAPPAGGSGYPGARPAPRPGGGIPPRPLPPQPGYRPGEGGPRY